MFVNEIRIIDGRYANEFIQITDFFFERRSLNLGVNMLLEFLCCVIVIKRVAFFTIVRN